MSNFLEALNRKADEVERPKPLPVGTYLCTIPGPPEMKTIGQNNTPVAEFAVKVISPREDVDSEALLAVGGAAGKSLRLNFYLTEDALYRLKEFLIETCAIEPGGRTLGEMLPEAVNRMFLVTVRHKPSKDGSQIYAEIAGTAKA